MNTDISFASIKPILEKAKRWLRLHGALLGIVVVAGMYGYLLLQINLLSQRQPDETAVQEKIQTVKHPNIRKEVAEKLESLEDNSDKTKALFQAARDNPFLE